MRLFCFTLLLVTTVLIPGNTWGQDDGNGGESLPVVEIFSSSGTVEGGFIPDGDAFGGGPGESVMIMSSDISIGDGAGTWLGGGGGQADKGSRLMDLLKNESIRKEIELIDGQYKKMQKFQKERSAAVGGIIKDLMKNGKLNLENLNGKALKDVVVQQQENAEKQLEEMLLPHQIERLRQVAHQVRMQQIGTATALTSGELADALKLSDDDKKKLRLKSKEVEARVKAEIAKLKADARRELIGILPTEKQEKLKEMIGDEFQYEKKDLRARLQEMMSRGSKKAKSK